VRIHAAGPQVRLELSIAGSGRPVTADVDQRWHEKLALAPGDNIFVWPQSIRLFDDDGARALLLDQSAGIYRTENRFTEDRIFLLQSKKPCARFRL
jgi:hypothetical protein